MKKHADLILDIDQVLLNFNQGFKEYCREVHNIRTTTPDPQEWSLAAWLSVSEARTTALIEEFSDSPYFGALVRQDGYLSDLGEYVSQISLDVYAVTSCLDTPATRIRRECNLAAVGALRWLKEIIYVGRERSKLEVFKGFEPGAVVIDDNVTNVRDAIAAGHEGYLYTTPYNQGVYLPRVQSLNIVRQLMVGKVNLRNGR